METRDKSRGDTTRGIAKSREGVVVSAEMDKTAVVSVVRQMLHPQYHKYVKRTKKYYAHDERNECKVGDTVRIVEARPLSKLKRWRVQEILKGAE